MGGYQHLVRGDVVRGKFRNSLEVSEPFEPNTPTRVEFTMPDTYHCFRREHRIMVQVQSTWFPYIDRNPSTRPADRKLAISIFTVYFMAAAVLTIFGSFFRGPGFNFTFPWSEGVFFDF